LTPILELSAKFASIRAMYGSPSSVITTGGKVKKPSKPVSTTHSISIFAGSDKQIIKLIRA
jgi:hypothetical protein